MRIHIRFLPHYACRSDYAKGMRSLHTVDIGVVIWHLKSKWHLHISNVKSEVSFKRKIVAHYSLKCKNLVSALKESSQTKKRKTMTTKHLHILKQVFITFFIIKHDKIVLTKTCINNYSPHDIKIVHCVQRQHKNKHVLVTGCVMCCVV